MVGREVPEDDPDCGSFSTGPNLWPASLPKAKFQDRVMAYQARMMELVQDILGILAEGLPNDWECPPSVFDSLLEQPSIPMRFLHYGPVPHQDARQFGGEFSLLYRAVIKGTKLFADFENHLHPGQSPTTPISAACPSSSKSRAPRVSRCTTRPPRSGCPCPWSRTASSSTWAT